MMELRLQEKSNVKPDRDFAREEVAALVGSQRLARTFRRWSESRRQMSNIRFAAITLAWVALSLAGTAFAAMTTGPGAGAGLTGPARTGAADSAFGVTGSGQKGACAEISHTPDEPARLIDCVPVRLHVKNLDLDHLTAPRSNDLLVENGFLRAGPRTYFKLLDVRTRPSHAACSPEPAEKWYWVRLIDLPGQTLCVRTDESRVGVVQTESINVEGTVVTARLTVWDQR